MSHGLLLDTHVWLWYAVPNPRLKQPAREAIDSAVSQRRGLHISIMSIWEISMLESKGQLHLGNRIEHWMEQALALPGLRVMPLEAGVILDAHRLPGRFHADPVDRLIVATARHHELTLKAGHWAGCSTTWTTATWNPRHRASSTRGWKTASSPCRSGTARRCGDDLAGAL
jgi:PIN domain nuclease of toxin-antitoxin system